jgi:hypothetical protein
MLTGRGGRVSPRTVSVAPFVAVDVTLSSADGASYTLTYAGRRLAVGPAKRTAKLSLPGIATGRRYVLTGARGQSVTIVSTGEPGP